ncbi:MAG: DNA translocase FtsK [Halanaerobiaceae bacterium]
MPKTTTDNEMEDKTYDNKSIQKEILEKRKNEILGILIIALSILSAIALFTDTAGPVGKQLSQFYQFVIGYGAYLIPILFLIWGITLIRFKGLNMNSRLIGFLVTYVCIMSLIHNYQFDELQMRAAVQGYGGGIIGWSFSWLFRSLFGQVGSYVINSAFLLIGFLLWFDVLLISILKKIKIFIIELKKKIKSIFKRDHKSNEMEETEKNVVFSNLKETFFQNDDNNNESVEEQEDMIIEKEKGTIFEENNMEETYAEDFNIDIDNSVNDKEENKKQNKKQNDINTGIENNNKEKNKSKIKNANEQDSDIQNYRLPSIKLLDSTNTNRKKPGNKSTILENTLQSFGVNAKVIKVSHGPTITRYEVQPASGVKVSKIVNLADDIALALAAPGVRIEAPIPGKAAVGIEVPHMQNITIRIRDIISSNEFQNSSGKLQLALGMGIDGSPIVTDLSKMPHLLVAGATGSGKSVCINTIITSILYKATPDEVKLLLVDPKKVELTSYKDLPHLFAPVVTDPKKAASVLKLVVTEMENRYDLFSGSGTRGITSYNKKVSDEDKLPYIVVIVDELSDLMMVSASDVEDNICRLAQMARAAGIHLVIATQRPSVDVITGLIKANIPSRISFAVSSQTDSRTILDMGGAEKLLGKGDMLIAPAGTQKPQRVQGAFIDNDEISRIVDFVRNQANPDYIFDVDDINEIKIEMETDDERDELYQEAIKLVVNYRASISMLQRRLHVGHSRAARMIDMMEEDGIVGPYAGSKAREVLISSEELDDFLNGKSSDNDECDNENDKKEAEVEEVYGDKM